MLQLFNTIMSGGGSNKKTFYIITFIILSVLFNIILLYLRVRDSHKKSTTLTTLTQHEHDELHIETLHFSNAYDYSHLFKTPSTNFKEKIWRLIEAKYGTKTENLEEFNKMKDNFNSLNWPIKIYIYSLPDDPPIKQVHHYLEENRDLFIEHSNKFFPHIVLESFINARFGIDANGTLRHEEGINNEYFQIVATLKEADIAYIPFRQNGYFFFYDTAPIRTPFDFITRNEMLRNIWNGYLSYNNYELYDGIYNTDIPHFVSFSYVCFRCSYHMIPPKVKILNYEIVGVTGQPLDAWYENGCYDRCFIVPYVNYFDWPNTPPEIYHHIFYPHPYNEITFDKWYHDEWKNRPYFITFIGASYRTLTLVSHRAKLVTGFQKKYSDKGFHWFKESWTSSSNIEIYSQSKFCIQLHGDTPTRNGFYESWLSGCIPLTVEKSFLIYRPMFAYTVPVEEMSVVVPNKYYINADIDEVWEELKRIEQHESLNRLKLIANHYDMFRYSNITDKIDAYSYAMSLIALKMPLTPPPSLITETTSSSHYLVNNEHFKIEKPYYFLNSPITGIYKFKTYIPQLTSSKRWWDKESFESIQEVLSTPKATIYIYGNDDIDWESIPREHIEKIDRILALEAEIYRRAKTKSGMKLTDEIEKADLIYIPIFTLCYIKECSNFTNPDYSLKSQINQFYLFFENAYKTVVNNIPYRSNTPIFTFFNIPEMDSTVRAPNAFDNIERLISNNKNLFVFSDNVFNLNNRRYVIPVPYLEPTFDGPSTSLVKDKKQFIQGQNKFTCYFGDLRIHPISVFTFLPEVMMKSTVVFTFGETYTQKDLEGCIYTIIPNGSPSDLFTKAILAGSIPVLFPNNEKFYTQIYGSLFDFDKAAIIVPKKITEIDDTVSSVEFTIEFLRFLQNRHYDEILERREYIQRIQPYFSLASSIDSIDLISKMIHGGRKYWKNPLII